VPASPGLAEGLARATVAAYSELEALLLRIIADALARGTDSPTWALAKLTEVSRVLAGVRVLLATETPKMRSGVRTAIEAAWDRGGANAVADLARLGLQDAGGLKNAPVLDVLIRETTAALDRPLQARVLRATEDVYRAVVAEVSVGVSSGAETRLASAQRALDRFADRGVTGFTDKAGRSWELASYVEMALRTSTGRAAVEAHADRLQRAGLDYVWVSDVPQECVLCRPWEGQVLALTQAALASPPAGVRPAATLGAAQLAGFQHPNCRHSIAAYIAGATRLPHDTEDPEGDADRQRLRTLERHVRAWKRREAAAMTPDAAAKARGKVRAYQGAIRDHVRATSAKRQPQRERIGTAR
jgi:hypothetical protein